MRIHPAALTAVLLAARETVAFVPGAIRPNVRHVVPRMTLSMVDENINVGDVSIPYDAAARLAYDEWRDKFNKGPFDPERYEVFRANYETITVANVVAKKKARDAGDAEVPAMMSLNEFGDCTEEEYAAAQKQQSVTATSTGSVLGKALEAAVSQSEASSALEDAANALAEEEEVSFLACMCRTFQLVSKSIFSIFSFSSVETRQTIRIGECRGIRGCPRFT
jgi:hypothetical protein